MPSVIPSSDVESLSEGRDTDVVMSKTRMHLRILHAELEYLSEQNVRFENPEFQRLATLIAEKFPGNVVDNESAQFPEAADVKKMGGSTRSSNVPGEQTIHW
ncbi:hypothetical protein N7471_013509 [Penicillium samsonianum]|uniref:uncharacterized protein n=1 Tax=Penicillium samsonianum TaxID=1882272 RepID=UPI002548CE10|nr:uncharacterized protein N7471_013509 [Penicillium samsonianum]KAJ6118889.1 hypothetical protein N7471_013509 [Penicillium samsonianum]